MASPIDSYIEKQRAEIRPQLFVVRDAIRRVLPDAEERISWGMPTWWQGRNIIHFAAMKTHIGIYPGASAVGHFAPLLDEAGFSYNKGAIRIPYGEMLPVALIAELARWCGEHADAI